MALTLEAKPEFWILIGLPASGKTIFAKKWLSEDPDRVRISWDDLRLEMFGPDWVFDPRDESLMKAESHVRAKAALEQGKSVIIDNTNLTENVRNRWLKLAEQYPVTIVEHEIDTPVTECIRRDGLREGRARVGADVILKMAEQYGFGYVAGNY